MTPVYRAWLKIGHLLGRIVTIILLTVSYYTVITPIAIAKRVLGGRDLPMMPDKNKESYWRLRDMPMQSGERFYKRY
jgi:hypothetical protein